MSVELTQSQRRQMNNRYKDKQPSETHIKAFQEVIQVGCVSDSHREKMVDMLYEPLPDRMKNLPVDPYEPVLPTDDEGNGLGTAATRDEYGITLHISERLYHEQPIGVLLRPIDDNVRKANEALITDTCPRSATVEDHIMPCKHYKLRIEPFPLWMESWMGENGYPLF